MNFQTQKTKKVWPDGKKFAFSLCFDVDSWTIWKLRANDYQNGDNYIRSLSLGDYGVECGVQNILDILDRYHVTATFFVPAIIMKQNSQLIKLIQSKGHEIAHHGYAHEYDYGETAREQLKYINQCQQIFEDVIGHPATGFRPTGSLLPEVVEKLSENSNNLYLISEKGAERPYYKKVNEKTTSLIELPARIEFDDYYQLSYNYFPPQPESLDRIAPYEDVLTNYKAEIDGAHEFQAHCITAFHPQVSGTPGKSIILARMIEYLQSFDDLWLAPCKEVAMYWRQNF